MSLFSTLPRPNVTSQRNLPDLSSALGRVDHSLFLETIVLFSWLSSYRLVLGGWILYFLLLNDGVFFQLCSHGLPSSLDEFN